LGDYRVGQVLYVIPANSVSIVPIQVMERRISETATGIVTKHIVKSPKQKSQPMVLETIKGSIFTDAKLVRDAMVKNAITAIDNMVKNALSVAKQSFSVVQQQQQNEYDNELEAFAAPDMFAELQTNDVQHQANEQLAFQASQQKQQIEKMQASEQAVSDIDDAGMTEVMLPDGTKKRVKIKMSS
jgi:hypothetical protein